MLGEQMLLLATINYQKRLRRNFTMKAEDIGSAPETLENLPRKDFLK